MELFEAMATARAIRRYRPDPIPEEDLQKIFWAASRAPSGSNRQAYRFVVLRNDERSQQARLLLRGAFQEAWAEKGRVDGYDAGSGAVADSPKARMAASMQWFVDHIHEAPIIVLACLQRYRAESPTEGASLYPAVQNLLLAARGLGYGGVITAWHAGVDAELKQVLDIPSEVAVHTTIPLGRPMGNHGPVRRRPLAELVYEGGWGREADWATDPDDAAFTQAGPPRRAAGGVTSR